MPRFFGKVGYAITSETEPSVWTTEIQEREYYGDIIRNSRRYEQANSINGEVVINNSISILADAFASKHFASIRYVELYGVKCKVTNVEVRRPRLVLTIGGEYNE